jgi:hypothetical protein
MKSAFLRFIFFGTLFFLSISYAYSCGIPVYRNSRLGFSVGKPTGWLIEIIKPGIVIVSKNQSGRVGAFIFPVRVRSNVSTARLFQSLTAVITRIYQSKNGTFHLYHRWIRGNSVGAVGVLTWDGTVYTVPIWMTRESGFATLKLYLAPKYQFNDESPILKQVIGCYHRETYLSESQLSAGREAYLKGENHARYSTQVHYPPLRPIRTPYYTAMIPENWRVKGETQNGFDLVSSDNMAGVSYAYYTGGFYSPIGTLEHLLSMVIPSYRVVKSGRVPSSPGWSAVYIEFKGIAQGTNLPVEGVIRGDFYQGYTTTITIVHSAYSLLSRWHEMFPFLIKIAGSIQPTQGNMSQQIGQMNQQFNSMESAITSNQNAINNDIMEPYNYRSRVTSESTQQWSDAILGQDQVKDPETGDVYDVPSSAWNSNGIGGQGSGFYRYLGNGQYRKLTLLHPGWGH